MRTHRNTEPHPNPTTATQHYDISGQQPFAPGIAGPSSGPNVFVQPGPYFVGDNNYFDDGQFMHAVPEHGQFVPQQHTHAGHAHSPQMYHHDYAGTGNLINTYANEFVPDDMQQQYSHGGLNAMCQGQPYVPQHGISAQYMPLHDPSTGHPEHPPMQQVPPNLGSAFAPNSAFTPTPEHAVAGTAHLPGGACSSPYFPGQLPHNTSSGFGGGSFGRSGIAGVTGIGGWGVKVMQRMTVTDLLI
jgi:hypothetical protein